MRKFPKIVRNLYMNGSGYNYENGYGNRRSYSGYGYTPGVGHNRGCGDGYYPHLLIQYW